ncbi:MAG: ABC transporter ATP-binding protein [Acidimicrobiia bacterium]
MSITDLRKVYRPSPPAMRLLLRSSIKRPVVALDGVSLQVEAGHICAVVGPNGAGKSTLFRILTGLITPDAGRATIAGLDVSRDSYRVRGMVGFHPADDKTVFGRNTCFENLEFHGRMQGMPGRGLADRINEVLEVVGLSHARDRVAIALSSGMRSRLQLARALLHRPQVLILDEPTGTLDPVAAYELMNIISDQASQDGLAVLISSHRLEEIEALHDHVVLLDEGRVVYQGDLDSLRHKWEAPRFDLSFSSSEAAALATAALTDLRGVTVVETVGKGVTIQSERPIGEVISEADGHLAQALSISRVQMSVRELLADILGDPSKRLEDNRRRLRPAGRGPDEHSDRPGGRRRRRGESDEGSDPSSSGGVGW